FSTALALNGAGTAVGFEEKWSGDTDLGWRAVRWDASGTAATELDNLGTDSNGVTHSTALAVNVASVAVGKSGKYVGGTNLGSRAVRWDVSGPAAIELGNLGTSNSGAAGSQANAVNDAGVAVGGAEKYVGGTDLGSRAVRWDASGPAVTELGNLGTDSNGVTNSNAFAVNAAGVAVGSAEKWIGGAN